MMATTKPPAPLALVLAAGPAATGRELLPSARAPVG
jgi:hypothetical protein